MALEKALFKIYKTENTSSAETVEVLFNPSEYQIASAASYASHTVPGLNNNIVQFVSGQNDRLSLTLHLDTYTKTAESPTAIDFGPKKKPENVGIYVKKIMQMLNVVGALHAPPRATFAWGKLKFNGVVESINHTYTMFTEGGIPVRARLDISMRQVSDSGKDERVTPLESPDRTKRRVLIKNAQLWQMAATEYGDPALWREIARANSIDNPRRPPAGRTLTVPALE